MTARTRLLTLVVVGIAVIAAVTVALVLTLNRPQEAPRPDPVAATVPVALTAEGLPKDFSLGVVMTFGQSGEPGSGFNRAAQGAVVAAQRFAQGGANVALPTRNDRGTDDGAREAVTGLAEQGVSGIVVASTGSQAAAAAKTAEELGLPVILPYAEPAEPSPSIWTTKPSTAAVEAALQPMLADSSVLLVSDGGGIPPSLQAAQVLRLEEYQDVTELARETAVLTGDQPLPGAGNTPDGAASVMIADPADAVVVTAATPQRLARLVQALQSRNVSVPLLLPDGATAPDFASMLAELDGTASGQLITVASAGGDGTALQQDAQGRARSAFLSAVRQAAADPEIKNLTGDAPFAVTAWAADTASHDAVVALVRAAALAQSGNPAEIGAALRTLALGPGEGIAGPALDFSRSEALAAKAVRVHGSPQDLGLRPADEKTPRLVWIPAPEDP